MVTPVQNGLDTIPNCLGQFIWPLAYRLVRNADCGGGGGYGPTKQFDGFSFLHA